ncbi:unnamed protein product [Cylicocyclus nassatus]|uniref:Uncharacterized protein n=1 Tax=Cylicocyclus nassatus TaxID=53992 RepID=A0AA36GZ30_CYLNA|nr:unnamed protein product [Cylicocyclus nassatus]
MCFRMIQLWLVFHTCAILNALPTLESYVRKYRPVTSVEGTRTIRRYPKSVIEVTLTFGATDQMIQAAETAINDHYSAVLISQGEETKNMGKVNACFRL